MGFIIHTQVGFFRIFLKVLLISTTIVASRNEERYYYSSQDDYDPIFHHRNIISPYPRYVNFNNFKEVPFVFLHSRNPFQIQISPRELYESLSPDRIGSLIQAVSGNLKSINNYQDIKVSSREAKSLDDTSRYSPRMLPGPLSQTVRRIVPRFSSRSGIFNNRLFSRPSASRWNQRLKHSLSNMFPSFRPMLGNNYQTPSSSTNNPFYASFIPREVHPGAMNPFASHSFQAMHPYMQMTHSPQIHVGDFASSATYSHPLMSAYNAPHFPPYQNNPAQFQHFGPDLATSGSLVRPHPFVPPVKHNLAGSFPRHKPLFNDAGGLKGAALEISNAFADFTDSTEHGPEVTQKFGSVGHTINNFLQMMGLGASGGLTPGDVGGFGGGGSWASMDNAPIARSMDFYPGYGNQANLDDMDDLPIFHEDITEQFLTKMNLTDVLKKIKIQNMPPKNEGMKTLQMNSVSMDKAKNDQVMKQNPDMKEVKTHPNSNMNGKMSAIPNSPYVPAHTVEPKKSDKINPELSHQKPKTDSQIKMPIINEMKPVSSTQRPTVNYRVPSLLSLVSPEDSKKPIAVYKTPDVETISSKNKQTKDTVSYAPAHPLLNHEVKSNPNKLVNENIVRQWIPVTNGKGYVEKQPKPIIDPVRNNSEEPKGLKILKEVLATSKQNHRLAM